MIGVLIRLILFGVIIYFAYRMIRGLLTGVRSGLSGVSSGRGVESCPSCRGMIRVSEEPGSCPKCATPLGRSPDGKLLIKVN